MKDSWSLLWKLRGSLGMLGSSLGIGPRFGRCGFGLQRKKIGSGRSSKTNDDLLKAVWELKAPRAELPRKAMEEYKDTTRFELGLQRTGQVSYEYGYRVALA
ncbi:hypothetical protein BHM03_00006471 [Ensete ventricosum]|nr:hypothetical protein BHM03_00006471 [Ensete ventricosum]